MHREPAGIPVEALLAHRGWVRALAHGLAADASAADDLEQEAWLKAIRRPPAHATGLRSWFARVVRSRAADAARAEGARTRRERDAARAEAEPSTERLAQVAELQAQVVRAVLDLEEPYRSTVLLRYFEELPLEAVAGRTGAPLETVRTRIRRAHERLRERLDADHRGDRRAWLLLVVPGARGEESSIPDSVVPGGLFMGIKTKAALATAAILLLALVTWRMSEGEPPLVAPPVEVAATTPGPSSAMAPVAEAPPPPPTPIAEEPPPPPPPPAAEVPPAPPSAPRVPEPPPQPEGMTIAYRGRVLDDRRRPVPGAEVSLGVGGETTDSGLSDAAGRFELRAPPRPKGSAFLNAALRAVAPDGSVGVRPTSWRSSPAEWQAEILLSSPVSLPIRVVDLKGPVAGASVELWIGYGLLEVATTGPDGGATLGPLPSTGLATLSDNECRLLAHAAGRGSADATHPWPLEGGEPLTLTLTSQDLAVQVVDAETRKGIEGAEVRISRRFGDDAPSIPRPTATALTGPDGATTLRGLTAGGQYTVSAKAEGYGGLDWESGGTWLFVSTNAATRIDLVRSRTMRWPITDAEGPVPPDGAAVRLERQSRTFGSRTTLMGLPFTLPPFAGRVERHRSDGDWLVVDGLGGGVSFGGRPPFGQQFTAYSPDGRLATLRVPFDGPAGPPISFRKPRTISVLVRDEAGAPRKGVEVRVEGTGPERRVNSEYAVTDDRGMATIPDLAGGLVFVYLRDPNADDFGEAHSGKIDLEKGDASLEVVHPALRPVEVLVRMRMQGEPRLPAEFFASAVQGNHASPAVRTVEDPVAGTVRFTAWLPRPEEEFHVGVHCPGAPPRVKVQAGTREKAVEVSLDIGAPPKQARPAAPEPRQIPNPALPGETRDQRVARILDTDRFTYEPKTSKLSLYLLTQMISLQSGCPILLDGDLQKDVGHLEVSAAFKDFTIRDALHEILKVREDLTFVVRDGIVVVVRK